MKETDVDMRTIEVRDRCSSFYKLRLADIEIHNKFEYFNKQSDIRNKKS